MSKYTLPPPGEHPLYDAGRKIAFHTYQRFGVAPDEEFEDSIQQAAMTYWYHHDKRGRGPGYAWVAARRDLAYHRFVRNYNPRYPESLDEPQYRNYERPWLDDLTTAEQDRTGYTWRLTTDDLRMLVSQLYQSPNANVERDVQILDLTRRGWSLNAIALELGYTEETMKSYRKRLRRRLKDYCLQHDIPIPDLSDCHHMKRYGHLKRKAGDETCPQ